MAERIQKLLAAAGIASRRRVEDLLREGRITVNDRVAQLGDRAETLAELRIDGMPVVAAGAAPAPESREILLYHKPVGEVTTRHDPQGRPNVFARLPAPRAGRWVVVGRLDFNTAGLLLFTNDGALAHRLMHPSFGLEREYLVRLRGRPSRETVEKLRRSVVLEDGPARFDAIRMLPGRRDVSHTWCTVTLHEGRNREVRRLFEAVGHEVSRLTRLKYGPFELPRDLPPGAWRVADASLQRAAAAVLALPAAGAGGATGGEKED